MIAATCPCGQDFQAEPALAGQRVTCSTCGRPFLVPRLQAAAPILKRAPQVPGSTLSANPLKPTTHKPKGARKGWGKGLAIVLTVIGAIGGISAVVAVILYALPASHKHTSERMGVTMTFPLEPRVETRSIGSPLGRAEQVGIHATNSYMTCFVVGQELPRTLTGNELNGAFARSMQIMPRFGEVESSTTTVQGHPAREIKIIDDKVRGKARIVATDKWVYVVVVAGDKDKMSERSINRYINSFKIH